MGFEDQERKAKNSYQVITVKREINDFHYVEIIRVQNVWNPRERGYDENTFMVEIYPNVFPSATRVSVWNRGWEHIFTTHDVPEVGPTGYKAIRDELLRIGCEVAFGQEVSCAS